MLIAYAFFQQTGGDYMKLWIDNVSVTAQPGQTLLELIKELGLDSKELSMRPLAAKIAGEVFSLNYVPVRQKEEVRASIRHAMEASCGKIHLLRYNDPSGRDVYARTVQFVVFLAISQLWPEAKAVMSCTVGNALYITVKNAPKFSTQALKEQLRFLIEEDAPLLRRRVSVDQAICQYDAQGKHDKARLLRWRPETFFDEYTYGDYSDYFYGELLPSMGYLTTWDILPAEEGFFFIYPDDKMPDRPGEFIPSPKYLDVCTEGKVWSGLMECETVADLNDMVQSGKIRELIRVNEALHEKNYAYVADSVCDRGVKAVMLAGPSSSGKTTSGNRLVTQLRVHGKKPILMGLDDYYIDRDKIAPGPDGKLDLEHINTIDTELFREHMKKLLAGEEVELPSFNFITGKREWKGHKMHLSENTVIIVEGLHALNPALLPDGIEESLVFRLYVSPLLPLNLDDHNRIPSSTLRLLRRIVRDYATRGSTVEQTMSMWDSVRAGEIRWIYPYQENADMIFNSSTLYELPVLKRHIFPLLKEISPEQPCYEQVRSIVKILNYVLEADVDDEIPPTSLVREFIGGNSFYK